MALTRAFFKATQGQWTPQWSYDNTNYSTTSTTAWAGVLSKVYSFTIPTQASGVAVVATVNSRLYSTTNTADAQFRLEYLNSSGVWTACPSQEAKITNTSATGATAVATDDNLTITATGAFWSNVAGNMQFRVTGYYSGGADAGLGAYTYNSTMMVTPYD